MQALIIICFNLTLSTEDSRVCIVVGTLCVTAEQKIDFVSAERDI
jgi:hypothetical protein